MAKIDAIITKNDAKTIIEEVRKLLIKGIQEQPLKDIRLVDCSDDEVVILASIEQMNQEVAEAFWLGYKKALE